MKHIDDELKQLINAVLKEDVSPDEPIQSALLEAHSNNRLFFSLQTKYGLLVDTAMQSSLSISGTWKQSVLQALVPDSNAAKRFIFSVSPKMLNVISCFIVNNSSFYATITVTDPQVVQQYFYTEIIRILNRLCDRCKKILIDFVKQLFKTPEDTMRSCVPHCKEKLLCKQIAEFSSRVSCTALIDSDGFILNAQGNAEEVEKVTSNVALFHQRCIRELGFRKTVNVQSETFSCEGNTILIGQIRNSNLSLAISTQGEYSKPLASFLFELAQSALIMIAESSGILWGAPIEKLIEPTRVRNSWFSIAQLIPKGKCVSIKGGKTFHFPSCKNLLKTKDQNLDWYDKRVDAIRSGLSPCKSCNP